MPKEIIQHPNMIQLHSGSSDGEGNTTEEITFVTEPRLTVHWSNALATGDFDANGEVRLSVANYAPRTEEEVHGAEWPPETDTEIFTANLDRAALNRLIHAARRARDAAYGKDA